MPTVENTVDTRDLYGFPRNALGTGREAKEFMAQFKAANPDKIGRLVWKTPVLQVFHPVRNRPTGHEEKANGDRSRETRCWIERSFERFINEPDAAYRGKWN